ncbi:MAG TPA: hypothetical protein PKJ08_11750 [Candidatus Cloacimonadota bacterium]|nr:hypothetical protein [Candidatus Cloacimonadota bacterium]
MIDKIYLTDTNVVVNYAEAFLKLNKKEELDFFQKISVDFWSRCGNQTLIPSIVWAEFLGVWYQKKIDLNSYDFWFQKQYSVYEKLYYDFKQKKVAMPDDSKMLYKNILSVAKNLTNKKFPLDFVDAEKKRLRNRRNPTVEQTENQIDKAKVLDGLDSVIVAYTFELARLLPTKQIVLVTNDYPTIHFVNYFSNNKNQASETGIIVPFNIVASDVKSVLRQQRQ